MGGGEGEGEQVSYHTPPRFPPAVVAAIRAGASAVFRSLGLRDFARLDGWYLPSGEVVFSDLNMVSGMEQTSFLFQQAAQVGLSHAAVLRWILNQAAERYAIPLAPTPTPTPTLLGGGEGGQENVKVCKKVWVLFGGDSSERQVSLMSGTNVWLKLRSWGDVSPTTIPLYTLYYLGSEG